MNQKPGIKPYIPTKSQPSAKELTGLVVKGTFTKQELLRRIRLLNDFISYRLFESEGVATAGLQEQTKKFFESHKQNAGELDVMAREADWLNSLEESFFAKFTKENFNSVFDELEKELSAVVPLILYLPFFMPDSEQHEVGTWLKSKVSPNILFEANYDPNLIGGCSLSYRGILKDYSIHSKLESNKQLIIDELKGFKKG